MSDEKPQQKLSDLKTKYYDGKQGTYLCQCSECQKYFWGDKRDFGSCPDCEKPVTNPTPDQAAREAASSIFPRAQAMADGWSETEWLLEFNSIYDNVFDAITQATSQKDSEIERLRGQVRELEEVLAELRDAVKLEPAMNNMKYDALGARVNKALSTRQQMRGQKGAA